MSRPAIVVDGISKKYRIGLRPKSGRTLREAIVDACMSPLRRLRAMGEEGDSEDTFWALSDVSFEVEPGEVVGIIGRNGAGKSTLLKILSRITEPTRGRTVIDGRVGSLLEIGTGFHPELTGRENVYLNGAILGMRKAEIRRKFDEIVAFSEVEKFLDTPVKHYSSGMFVRLAFAVAAHLEPEILIVDEVLAVGDEEFQKKCLGKMRDVAGGGRTVLFVSHNMTAIERLCTAAVELKAGRVEAYGPSSEIVSHYMRSMTATFCALEPIHTPNFTLLDLSVNGQDNGNIKPLQPVTIRMRIRAKRHCCEIAAHILFEDDTGYPVLGLDSRDFTGTIVCDKGWEVSIEFDIPSFPISPGSYRLHVWIKSQMDGVVDEVSTLFPVEVVQAIVYGHSQLSQRWHGHTVAPAQVRVVCDQGNVDGPGQSG